MDAKYRTIWPRTVADRRAEAATALAPGWQREELQQELDDFAVGRRRRDRNRAVAMAVFEAACTLLEDFGSTFGAALAREWAAQAVEGESVRGVSAIYFWTRVACALESGEVR